MVAKPLIYFSQICHSASKNVEVPRPVSLIIRIISNLQIISLVLSDSMLSGQQGDSSLARSVKTFCSSIKSVLMLSGITSELFVSIVAFISYIYISLQLALITYFIIQIYRSQNPHPWASKLFPVITHIHSQVVFYPLHCFFLRLMNSYLDCSTGSSTPLFYCGYQWIILPSLFAVFNVILPFIKELYCFQILFQRDFSAQKDNIYPILNLTQKKLIITLYYFLTDPQTTIIVLNILFCLASFFILHTYLTYYDLKLLRLEVAFSTAALLFSILMLTQPFGYKRDITLWMTWTSFLAIKLSLRRLNRTLVDIVQLKFKNPHQAVHLPFIIKEHLGYARVVKVGRKFTKSSLYISSLLKESMQGELNLQDKQLVKEAKFHAYTITIQKLEDQLKIHPNNQLIVLSMVRIYMKKLKDSSRALYLLDRMKAQNVSIPIRNSILSLYSQLDDQYSAAAEETKQKLGYLHYFEYRDKTIKLKGMIEEQLGLQIKLWEAFNTDPINAYDVIGQAQVIDKSEAKIYSYWQREVQCLEKLYVNAPILFGLYLEIVRGLPYTGSALIQQTYKLILDKGVLQEDILNVSIGKSAIIIASGEAEKAGKVIDASASVKELFGIDRTYLLHSNLNLILPKVLSQKHDQLMRKFHEKPSENQVAHIASYGRTLQDEYFPVDIALRPLPSSNGMNIVAYIKKVSSNVSLMIVDYHGRVVECSRDLQRLLNLDSRGSIELTKICPRLMKVSQAFNIVHAPEEVPQEESVDEQQYFENPLPSPATSEFPLNKFNVKGSGGLKAIFMKRNRSTNNEDRRMDSVMSGHQLLESEIASPLASPTTKLLRDKDGDSVIYSPTEFNNNKDTLKPSMSYEVDSVKTSIIQVDKNASEGLEGSRKSNESPILNREEAEAICNKYKGRKKLKFTIPPSSAIRSSRALETVTCETQIEPFLFAGQFFKIIKVKKISDAGKELQRDSSKPVVDSQQVSQNIDQIKGIVQMYAKAEASPKRSKNRNNTWTPHIEVGSQSVADMSDDNNAQDAKTNLDYSSENDYDENGNSYKDVRSEYVTQLDMPKVHNFSKASRTGSVINSTGSVKNRAKYLDALFKRETISYATKLAVATAYLSIVIVIGSVCVDLSFTTEALTEMEAALELIYISNARLFKLIASWRGVLILYSRTAGVRPNNNARTITVFSEQIRNYTRDMLDNNNLLRTKVDNFKNEYITELFYRRRVSLWLPYEKRTLNDEKVDLFTANQVLATKNLFVANFKDTPMGLLNLSEPLFAQNNTANDYLIEVQGSISEVANFFETTAKNNVSLLKVIVALESLALVVPFVSLLVLYRIITTGHQKLFRVISKIKKKHVEARIFQLNKMSGYLKKNIEDSVVIYKDDISSQLTKAKLGGYKDAKEMDDQMSRSRLYTMKTLVWRMILYLLFALVLLAVITSLFWTSFNSSTSGFTELTRLNSQVNTVFYYGSYISSLLSTFYYVLNFANQTQFKIRNDLPANQLRVTIETLGSASEGLLTSLSTPDKGIDDPAIESMLKQKICDYDVPENVGNCGLVTMKNAVGLLGLNDRFYKICGFPMLSYLDAPTAALGKKTMDTIVNDLGNFHTTAMTVYQVLAKMLYTKVINKKAEEADSTLTFFKWNIVVIVIVMLFIRVVVITKYKSLDLAVKKILKLIPFNIIQNNKGMMFYLSREFESEISDITSGLSK